MKKETNKMDANERRIIKEDIEGLKVIIEYYKRKGKFQKAAECESEMNELKRKLKGVNNGF